MEMNMLPPGGAGEPREPETVCGCVNSAQSDPGLVTRVGVGAGGLTASLLVAQGLGPRGARVSASEIRAWALQCLEPDSRSRQTRLSVPQLPCPGSGHEKMHLRMHSTKGHLLDACHVLGAVLSPSGLLDQGRESDNKEVSELKIN